VLRFLQLILEKQKFEISLQSQESSWKRHAGGPGRSSRQSDQAHSGAVISQRWDLSHPFLRGSHPCSSQHAWQQRKKRSLYWWRCSPKAERLVFLHHLDHPILVKNLYRSLQRRRFWHSLVLALTMWAAVLTQMGDFATSNQSLPSHSCLQ
jgi:hypothetical protein